MIPAVAPAERFDGVGLRDALHAQFCRTPAGNTDPNSGFVAQMLASWLCGIGQLPEHMGLGAAGFSAMTAALFPTAAPVLPATDRPPLDADYSDELADIRAFLGKYRAHRSASETWIIDIVAAGCLSNDHLWSDLGLFSRAELSAMLMLNFPELAARNTMNMKWKKFIYRQLCEAHGCYICRAPSCQECTDYAKCFILPEPAQS